MVTDDKLKEILIKSGADIDSSELSMSKTFEELGLDSLDVFNFFTEIDSELGVDVPDEDFESLKTLTDVQEYVMKKTG